MIMILANDGDSRRRPAFTLVELVVVISIIIVLSGITIAFLTGYNGPASSARGATMVQQTLTVARSEALRARRPYGVRLVPDPSNANHILQLQFIEQPDDFFGGRAYVAAANLSMVHFQDNIDLYGGFGAAVGNQNKWPVQPGDYIELRGSGLVRRITALANNGGVCKSVQVANPFPYATTQSPTPATGFASPNQFRIIRMPRVVGEEPIHLPDDIAIDIGTNATNNALYGTALPVDPISGAIDILFSPSGAVISRGVSETPIYLWVRNVALPPPNNGPTFGDPTIIALYPRTGSTAAHPVNTIGVNPDPYLFAKDGRSSGL